MSYEVDLNRAGSASRRREIGLAMQNNSSGRDGASAHFKFYELEPAVVMDINLTDSDSTKIGNAIVRPIISFATTPDANLPEAKPLDSNVKSFPLIGEVVIVAEYQGQLYYFQRLNFFNLVNQNIVKSDTTVNQNVATTDYDASSFGNPNVTAAPDQAANNGGLYFIPNKNIKSLLPMEGDVIYEGRSGNSIRIGSSVPKDTDGLDIRFNGTWANGVANGSPIIIIRNGQRATVPKGNVPYVEDINKDPSSLYLTTDQTIPFTPSSKNQKTYNGTAPSVWDGAQVLIASDRIAFNARKNEIFLFSAKSIGLSTEGTVNIDSTKEMFVNSSKIYLGLNATEHLILGDKTKTWLEDLLTQMGNLISAINTLFVITSPSGGPSSTVQASGSPGVQQMVQVQNSLSQLRNKMSTLLSKQNFTL